MKAPHLGIAGKIFNKKSMDWKNVPTSMENTEDLEFEGVNLSPRELLKKKNIDKEYSGSVSSILEDFKNGNITRNEAIQELEEYFANNPEYITDKLRAKGL